MDRERIEEQIVLLLAGEDTDIPEEEIRRRMSGDPKLRAFYEDMLSVMESTSGRDIPPVPEKQWDIFMSTLHERIAAPQGRGVIVRMADFFRSPVRVAAAAAAVIMLVGLLFIMMNGDRDVVPPDEDTIAGFQLEGPPNLEAVTDSYVSAANLMVSDDELDLLEEIHAELRELDDFNETRQDLYPPDDYDELRLYYGMDDQEDRS
jgi:hypothetical protein